MAARFEHPLRCRGRQAVRGDPRARAVDRPGYQDPRVVVEQMSPRDGYEVTIGAGVTPRSGRPWSSASAARASNVRGCRARLPTVERDTGARHDPGHEGLPAPRRQGRRHSGRYGRARAGPREVQSPGGLPGDPRHRRRPGVRSARWAHGARGAQIADRPADVHKITSPDSHLIISMYPSKYEWVLAIEVRTTPSPSGRSAPRIVALARDIASLSEATAEYRFFGPVKHITKSMMVRYCHIDYDTRRSPSR